MGMTFSLLFVLVGALFIYATVGRIVDEQRKLVGASKALGLYNKEIFAKYLTFGVSATAIGMALGVVLGYFGIQMILLAVYGRYFVFGAGHFAFNPVMTAVVFAGGILLASATVWSACSDLLRSTATRLMQEKAPSANVGKGGKQRGSLYWRLIKLNMLTDKKRVAVTIVSVAGCCALLVAGFTMRSAVMGGLSRQFETVTLYDAKIDCDTKVSETVIEDVEAVLSEAGADWTGIYSGNTTYTAGGRLDSCELMCGELAEIDRYFVRRDVNTRELLGDSDEGVYIHMRTAEVYSLKTGDEITFYDAAMRPYPVRIAGIFNIHAGREMVMSAKAYETVFGEDQKTTSMLVRYAGDGGAELWKRIGEIRGVVTVTDSAELRETYQSYAGVLDLIAAVLTGIAGMMAYFILLNLANMYINNKKRELTIMRVNGFTMKETIRYVAGEAIATTVIGILLGFAAGSVLARKVISLLENGNLQFLREIQWSAWIYAALITSVFSLIIYAAALRKVKDLKLTDIA
jgi:ABC-type lipoprotein release transport system permease subunit